MSQQLSITIPNWVYNSIIKSKPENLSERIAELIVKGIQSEKKGGK